MMKRNFRYGSIKGRPTREKKKGKLLEEKLTGPGVLSRHYLKKRNPNKKLLG